MKPGLVHAHRCHFAQATHDFGPDRDTTQQIAPAEFMPLCRSQQRRNDHHAGMHRPAFVGVVKILTVRGNAIDKGGTFGAQPARCADHGAGAITIHGLHGSPHIVLTAGRNTQTADVQQHAVGNGSGVRCLAWFAGQDATGQTLRHRDGADARLGQVHLRSFNNVKPG
jgi:hypothetical protein